MYVYSVECALRIIPICAFPNSVTNTKAPRSVTLRPFPRPPCNIEQAPRAQRVRVWAARDCERAVGEAVVRLATSNIRWPVQWLAIRTVRIDPPSTISHSVLVWVVVRRLQPLIPSGDSVRCTGCVLKLIGENVPVEPERAHVVGTAEEGCWVCTLAVGEPVAIHRGLPPSDVADRAHAVGG